jgi:MoaA/NifB/PqqE/SkfB family radical SAM enzyme
MAKAQLAALPVIVTGLRLKLVLLIMRMQVLASLVWHLKSIGKAIQTGKKFQTQINQYKGKDSRVRMVSVDGQFHWDMYAAPWPSKTFISNGIRESNRVNSPIGTHVGMRNVLMAITTKCPLQCEHCFEWNNLNLPEKLSTEDLQAAIQKLIDYGVGQIHLSGGEPMMRYTDIITILNKFHENTGFWIITSGYGFTRERAQALKKAGLIGVSISLDHFDEYWHNNFRHHKQAYTMAVEAAQFCVEAGLVVNLSLCVTKDFLDRQNLQKYLELAKQLGASFVQLLEPKAVGHYEGKPVQLSIAERQALSDFYLETQRLPVYDQYPIVLYHEHYKKTLGCRGAGVGNFYIDPLGNVHACPFCRFGVGNIVKDSVATCVERLWSGGCKAPVPVAKQEADLVLA